MKFLVALCSLLLFSCTSSTPSASEVKAVLVAHNPELSNRIEYTDLERFRCIDIGVASSCHFFMAGSEHFHTFAMAEDGKWHIVDPRQED